MTAVNRFAGPVAANAAGSAFAEIRKSGCGLGRAAPRGMCGDILLTRTIGGVGVATKVSRKRFRGLLLSLSGAHAACRVILVGAEGSPDIPLAEFDETEAVARWRAMASALGLAMLVRDERGVDIAVDERMGGVVRGAQPNLRRRKPLSRRRPRFLMRRKMSRLPLEPSVFQGREITATR
jgi:hypothetical protein